MAFCEPLKQMWILPVDVHGTAASGATASTTSSAPTHPPLCGTGRLRQHARRSLAVRQADHLDLPAFGRLTHVFGVHRYAVRRLHRQFRSCRLRDDVHAL